MGQTQTVGKTATTIKTDSRGWTAITYHSTTVVEFNARYVILRTGGWRTATTKARMNQAASQFGLGYSVSQTDFQWYVAAWEQSEGGTRYNMHGEALQGSEVIIDRKTGKILFNGSALNYPKWTDMLKKIGYLKA